MRSLQGIPWQTVALYCVYPAWQTHLKVPIVLLQLECSSHGLTLHSSMSSRQSPPVKPSGHSAQPVVSLHAVSLSRQLQSRRQSSPHVPLGHAAGNNYRKLNALHNRSHLSNCNSRFATSATIFTFCIYKETVFVSYWQIVIFYITPMWIRYMSL